MDEGMTAGLVRVIAAVAETIRALGSVPNGELYARVMSHMTFEQYDRTINILKGAKLVEEKNHELSWVGPKIEEKKGLPCPECRGDRSRACDECGGRGVLLCRACASAKPANVATAIVDGDPCCPECATP